MIKNDLSRYESIWSWPWIRQHPVRFFGIIFHLVLRYLYAIFYLAAAVNKIVKDWLTTDMMKQIFLDRLTELSPDTFASIYLENFALPLWPILVYIVVFGQLYTAFGLLLGLTTRWAAGMGLFFLINLILGGYYDASLLPFLFVNIAFLIWPSGLWLGLDRKLARKYPGSRWFG